MKDEVEGRHDQSRKDCGKENISGSESFFGQIEIKAKIEGVTGW